VFFPNDVELTALTAERDPIAALGHLDNGRTLTVVKRGARGALALDFNHHCRAIEIAPPVVDVADTTGAGDSFNAGFLHAWLEKWPLEECLRLGSACGALSTRGIGGTATQATFDEALRFGGIMLPIHSARK
jgi:sugar/nucleoside kinase (ribokinase family)